MTAATRTLKLPEALSLRGKTVLVTGAASGIGRASSLAVADLGARAIVTDQAPLDGVEAALRDKGALLECVRGNLSDVAFIRNTLLADRRVDALIHAAGIFPTNDTPEQETFEAVMQVNLRAAMVLSHECAQRMARDGGGRIVLIGSLAGRNGGVMIDSMSLNYAAYAVSKGGLHTMTKWLSRRMAGDNVLVNAIAPGVIRTPMAAGKDFLPGIFPMGRLGEMEEVAWPAAFLCTPAAGYCSGAILDVNGGAYVSG